ncbi:MAG: nucleotide exchange factor GrpE [Candidatus Electrothrix communis]|nr:nucleotide exchange factor GrpE [Desulfobulbus sp. US4]WLE96994.1 MAG: nucleotide exchange factor GrpE [Candidatus Electrothrix communis]
MPETGEQIAPDALLREKLIGFQREIAELKQSNRELEEAAEQQEQALLLGLFEVLDAFDNLEKNIQGKEGILDKTEQRFVKSTRAIQRKILRLLRSRHVEPLEFPENKARIKQCKIIATQNDPALENEEIISVEKKGYMDTERKTVLRKAEVVTVCNDSPPMISAYLSQNRKSS